MSSDETNAKEMRARGYEACDKFALCLQYAVLHVYVQLAVFRS
jgi:hypothetical protein